MAINLGFFAASFAQPWPPSSSSLPLSAGDLARLLTILKEDDYMYLVVNDGLNNEEIKITRSCDTIYAHRRLNREPEITFPFGSCIKSTVTWNGIKDLICNWDCCEGECPCVAVAVAGASLPTGKVGVPWTGLFIFSGDAPITLGISQDTLPSWVTVSVGPNFVKLAGTPVAAGSWQVTAAASNCSGANVVTEAGLIVVEA